MKETKYKSAWDWLTISIIALTSIFCFGLAVYISSVIGWIAYSITFLIILLPFLGVFYIVKSDVLIVHSFFGSKAYPISKIVSIKPTKSIESAPATSFFNRIAIYFEDRTIMKGYMPLIISPSNKEKFINQLLSINSKIKVE